MIYVARNEDGSLVVFSHKPKLVYDTRSLKKFWTGDGLMGFINDKLYPEIKKCKCRVFYDGDMQFLIRFITGLSLFIEENIDKMDSTVYTHLKHECEILKNELLKYEEK